MPKKGQLGDQRIRWGLGPPLGWLVSYAAGLQGATSWQQPRYWLGVLYFAMVSLMLWKGNVVIWFWLRGRPDWIVNPRRRLFLITGTVVAFSVSTCLVLFSIWFQALGEPIDWPPVWRATVLATLASVVIFHIYETIDLITQRAREHASLQQLEYAKALAQLSALKAQIDPHFMFNCLNTLVGLIETSPARAQRFTVNLGDVYRYILQSRTRELVKLADELTFVRNYHALLMLRFEDGVQLSLPAQTPEGWIPPVSLQLLLENAVKHNDFSSSAPLRIEVEIGEDSVSMRHPKAPAKERFASEGTGLQNLDERCRLILQRGIEVDDTGDVFAVTVPLTQSH
jgi:hypothetical protein